MSQQDWGELIARLPRGSPVKGRVFVDIGFDIHLPVLLLQGG